MSTNSQSGGLDLAIGDLNEDGHADAVLTRHDEYTIRVFLGNGKGTLAAAPALTTRSLDGDSPHTHDVMLADLTNDGHLDIITTNADHNAVATLLGDGTGHFRPSDGSPFPAGNHPYEGVTIADVDGDNQADIILPNLHGHTVSILLGNGEGRFGHAPGSPIRVGTRPGFTAVGRIDEGPMIDIVVTHDEGPLATVLFNHGADDAADRKTETLRLPERAWGAVLADLNEDGVHDLVLGGRDRLVMIHINEGATPFGGQPITLRSDYPHPAYPAVADVNGDGRLDLIVGHFAGDRERGNHVDVFLSR
jgi:hypothetical protein